MIVQGKTLWYNPSQERNHTFPGVPISFRRGFWKTVFFGGADLSRYQIEPELSMMFCME